MGIARLRVDIRSRSSSHDDPFRRDRSVVIKRPFFGGPHQQRSFDLKVCVAPGAAQTYRPVLTLHDASPGDVTHVLVRQCPDAVERFLDRHDRQPQALGEPGQERDSRPMSWSAGSCSRPERILRKCTPSTDRGRGLRPPLRLSSSDLLGQAHGALPDCKSNPVGPNQTKISRAGHEGLESDGDPRRRLQRMVGPRRLKYPTTEPRRQAAMGFR